MIERWTFAPMRRLLPATVALLVFASAPVQADNVPGMGNWEYLHNSTDPSPVTVRFRGSTGPLEFQIPRKYIVTAIEHSSRDGPVPDLLENINVRLAFAFPDGEAWTVATRRRAQERGIGVESAAREMRSVSNLVVVRRSGPVDYRNRGYGSERAEPDEETGLLAYTLGRSGIYFIGDAEDEFGNIDCALALNPRWLCNYSTHITPEIAVTASFVDFRLNGGRDFANQRMRFIRDTVCSFTSEC